MIIFAFANKIV